MTEMVVEDYKTICVVILGMAGTGKTTFVKALSDYLTQTENQRPYIANLDPAVFDVPYKPNIDIRKSVDYKKIMEQYNLGPNGAIITSLNLYATSFDQVINLIENRKSKSKYVLIDTPGQIEVFTWSASGSVIMECLMKTYPTIIVYLADSVKCSNPTTFMSNMTHSCSILYKYQLPFILAFNKTDIKDCQYAINWMQDFEEYGKAVDDYDSYISNLNRSLSLALDTYYENIDYAAVSSVNITGFDEIIKKVQKGIDEYNMIIKKSFVKVSQDEKEKRTNQTDSDNLIKTLPNFSIDGLDIESDGAEDLALPQPLSRQLNEKDVEISMKNMKV